MILDSVPARKLPVRAYERIGVEKVGYQHASIHGDGSWSHGAVTCVCDEYAEAHHHVDGAIRELPKHIRRFW